MSNIVLSNQNKEAEKELAQQIIHLKESRVKVFILSQTQMQPLHIKDNQLVKKKDLQL
jgi:hypothetical protein